MSIYKIYKIWGYTYPAYQGLVELNFLSEITLCKIMSVCTRTQPKKESNLIIMFCFVVQDAVKIKSALMSMIQESPWPSKNSNRTNTNLIHYWWQCGHAFISLSMWRWLVSCSSPAVGRMILFFLGDISAGDTLGNTRNLGVAIQFQFQTNLL